MPLHTVNRALLHSTGLPGDILYCTDDESFWLVLGAPTMRRVPVTSLFSGVHQCGRDGGRGEQGASGPQGPTGAPGRDGRDAVDGKDGPQGPQGPTGAPGRDGRDAPDLETIVDAVLARIVELGKTPTDVADDARRADIEATKQRAREMAEFLRHG